MKAVTLWEPWASLVQQGRKTVETRSWPFPKKLLGQRVAIHAAKRWTKQQQEAALEFIGAGLLDWSTWPYVDPFSLGKVLCTVVLADCRSTEWCRERWAGCGLWQYKPDEFQMGDYTPGRWAWFLADRVDVKPPVPAVGRQGFWNWKEQRK